MGWKLFSNEKKNSFHVQKYGALCMHHAHDCHILLQKTQKIAVSRISGISWTENVSLSHDKPKNMTKVKTKNIDSSCSRVEM